MPPGQGCGSKRRCKLMIGALILLFVLLYPAALIGGLIQGKLGAKAFPFRKLIYVGVYAVLAFVTLPMVAG